MIVALPVILGYMAMLFFFDPAGNTVFIPCPFHYVTGLYCPGCGSQRAFHSLLHLQFGRAIGYNLMMVVSIPFILAYYLKLLFTGKEWKILADNRLVWSIFAVVVLFWVMRNIPVTPFSYLAP